MWDFLIPQANRPRHKSINQPWAIRAPNIHFNSSTLRFDKPSSRAALRTKVNFRFLINIMKELVKTVTSKGQVTIPVEVRRLLGIAPRAKGAFIVEDSQVRLAPASSIVERHKF